MNLSEALKKETRFIRRPVKKFFDLPAERLDRFDLIDMLTFPKIILSEILKEITITEEDLLADDWEVSDGQ